ncbi:MAG TPA: integrase arm-type DNA-binding domain-containing protein [Novosphingobium sp.]|nr:integrase arm-type DNA-binding domain-containing protein [Novosphingobium sp.]
MLTDAACRKAKPSPDGKPRKLPDALGLYLTIMPSGYKVWRFKYRHAQKEGKLVIGPYPDVTLQDARAERDRVRALLRDGLNPSLEKKLRKMVTASEDLDTFELITRAWHKERAKTLSPRYAKQLLSRFEENVFPVIGQLPIKKITAPMILAVLRKIEARGAKEMAKRVRGHISDVFSWAIGNALADQDPSAVVRKALIPADTGKRPALVDLQSARQLLIKIHSAESAQVATRLASTLLALTAARPGVIRMAERHEFEQLNGPSPIWRISAEKMKLTRQRKRDSAYEFLIPLAPQAVEIVQEAMQTSQSKRWLFAGVQKDAPISDNTLSKLYRENGYAGRHVPHGWRATFSTIMNRIAAEANRPSDREIIDLMLAHIAGGVEPIYNRYLYMPRRRQIACEWAAMLSNGLLPAASPTRF